MGCLLQGPGRMCDVGTVLVVDDDAAVRAALKFVLEIEGFRVRLYDGPEAVLAAADLPRRGCFVIDYLMPRLDGIQLVEALRRRDVTLPAILITTQVSQQLCRLAERSGLRCVLEKPLSDATLVENIRGAMSAGCEQG